MHVFVSVDICEILLVFFSSVVLIPETSMRYKEFNVGLLISLLMP